MLAHRAAMALQCGSLAKIGSGAIHTCGNKEGVEDLGWHMGHLRPYMWDTLQKQ